jgi:sugar-specific transcriptional regulator TrmB
MPHPAHILSALGFSESEINTYLGLIKHGSLTASDLAKYMGLSRQTVYEAVDALSIRALVTTVEHEGKRFYRAEHPEKLLSYAKRREEEICQQVRDLAGEVPSLEMQMSGERPIVKMYEGREGVLAIIDGNRTTPQTTIYEMTDGDAMFRVLTREDLKPLYKTVDSNVKKIYGMYSVQQIEDFRKEDRERPADHPVQKHRLYFPLDETDFKSHVQIVGDTVTFVTFTGRMHAVEITHPFIAKAMRLLYKYAFRALHEKQKKI